MMNDPVFELIDLHNRQMNSHLNLIASENRMSPAVCKAMGSCLSDKYAEGYPGARYYGGCRYVDQIEQLAIDRAKELFHAEHANVQPHDGTGANMAAYQAFLYPGDRILSMSLDAGGHLSHGAKVSSTYINYTVSHYGVNDRGFLDYDEIRRLAKELQPRLIVCGASAYPREIRFDIFRQIADEIGAFLMADIAHIAGLVAAGCHMSPVPFADVTTMTVQKTLRAGRGGLILCSEKYAKAVDKAVFPGTQGGPLLGMVAGKAVGLGEALTDDFKVYIRRVCENAAALANQLMELGFDLVTGGTDNHLMLVDLRKMNITGIDAEHKLMEIGIICNKNAVPNDQSARTVCGGIRLGTPYVTSMGLLPEDMESLGKAIYLALCGGETEKAKALVDGLIAKQN